MSRKTKPHHLVYVVEDIDEDESFWTCIGASFPHSDKKGFNILLRALPAGGRLVLRKYTEKPPDKLAAQDGDKSIVT